MKINAIRAFIIASIIIILLYALGFIFAYYYDFENRSGEVQENKTTTEDPY